MKKELRVSIKSVMLFLMILAFNITVQALPYTAVNSGNWSNPATWGGVVPPTNNSLDQIIIPAGKTVTMDQDCNCNGLLASMNIMGTLNSTGNQVLTLGQCTLTGAGLIDVHEMVCNTGAVMLYTGAIVADVFESSALNLGLTSNITANDQLICSEGLLSILTGGHLTLGNDADIVISGGSLSLGSTSLTAGLYNVIYEGGSCICGDELEGAGLNNITISVDVENTVKLVSDLVVNGVLSLQSGSLLCNGNDLTINGDVAVGGTGDIVCTPASNITVNADLSGELDFSEPNNACNTFTSNPGPGNTVKINGNLTVNGTLNLSTGILDFGDCNLILNGLISGAGQLSANIASNLTVNITSPISTPIAFAPGGQNINDLILNCGSGKEVPLGSALTIHGDLDLLNGCNCNMDNQTLTLAASAVIEGTGELVTNNASGIICNCPTGLPSLHLATFVLGNLSVNANANAGVGLNENLTVVGSLSLNSGQLILNNHDLTISGNVAVGGTGGINSTLNSNITINASVAPVGAIHLTAGSIVDNFTVNLGANGTVNLGSDLNIAGSLNLTNGSINAGNYGVNLGAGALVNGGSSSNYIMTGLNGHLGINLTSGSGMVNFPVGTVSVYAPIGIQLNGGSGGGKIDVNVKPDVLEECESGNDISATKPVVDQTWNVTSNDVTSPNMNMKPNWSQAQEVNGFNRYAAYASQYNPNTGKWENGTPTSATQEPNGMYSIQKNNVTTFGCIAVFDDNTITSTIYPDAGQYYVYPTLVKDYIYVQDQRIGLPITDVEIVNINGAVVQSAKIAADISEIALHDLSPGSYFIKLNNSYNSEVKKFIKQ